MISYMILLLAESIQPTGTAAEEMLLTCDGGTMAQIDAASTTVRVQDSEGLAAQGSIDTRTPGVASFSVKLRIQGAKAEMTMPALAAPEYNSNQGGWFPVKNLAVSDSEISGRVRFNMFSSSTFRIDRRTGEIASSGGFHGRCRKQDLSQRAF